MNKQEFEQRMTKLQRAHVNEALHALGRVDPTVFDNEPEVIQLKKILNGEEQIYEPGRALRRAMEAREAAGPNTITKIEGPRDAATVTIGGTVERAPWWKRLWGWVLWEWDGRPKGCKPAWYTRRCCICHKAEWQYLQRGRWFCRDCWAIYLSGPQVILKEEGP